MINRKEKDVKPVINNKNINIDNELNKAKNCMIFGELDKAETMYKELCKNTNDYRPWIGLIEVLIEKGISSGDKQYKKYLNRAIELCNDNTTKKELEDKYNKYLEKEKTPKELKELGDKYYFGRGVTQDYKQAVYLYQKAADQGNAKAQEALNNKNNK